MTEEIAYFDSADLMVWFDQNVIFNRFDGAKGERIVTPEARSAAYTIVREAFNTSRGLSNEIREVLRDYGAPATMTLLMLWHEQRHFIDHMLTNFGASRVRLHWQIRAQMENIYSIAGTDGVLGLPLDVYSDPVECEALRLGPNGISALAGLGGFLADRRDMIDQDEKDGKTPVTKISVGGKCQLEALGSLAQIAGMTAFLRKEATENFNNFESHFNRFPYLEAILSVMQALGFKVIESRSNQGLPTMTINPNLVSAVLIASLMCRRSGKPGDDLTTSYLPARRLEQILAQLFHDKVRDARTADEAFSVVDKACKKIWNRSILDDLDEDLEFESKQLTKFEHAAAADDFTFLQEFHRARLEMRGLLSSDPACLIDGWRYATEIIPTVRPKIILADRSGQSLILGAGEPDEFKILFSEQYGNESSNLQMRLCYYLALKGADEGVVRSMKFSDKHWSIGFMKSRHIRLLTEGRKQAAGAELDAFLAERDLRRLGIQLRFRRGHDYPKPDRSVDSIFDMLGSKVITCEISGRQLTSKDAISLTPWDFERYNTLRQVLADNGKLGICPTDGSFQDDRIGNWTWWLVHRDYGAHLI